MARPAEDMRFDRLLLGEGTETPAPSRAFDPAQFDELLLSPRPKPPAPAAPPPEEGVGLEDYARSVMVGGANLAQGFGWLTREVGADSIGKSIEELGTNAVDFWSAGLSPAARKELAKEFVRKNEAGQYEWGDPSLSTVGLTGAQSLLGTAAGMGLGAGISKVLQTFANPFGRSVLAAAARTSGPTAVAAAKKLALVDEVIGAAGFGLGEGSVSAAQNGFSVDQAVRSMAPDKLLANPRYQEIYNSTDDHMSELERHQYATDTLAQEASSRAGWESGLVSSLLGAPMGAFFGRIIGGTGRLATTRLRSALVGAAGEGAQEFAQSAAEGAITTYQQRQAGETDLDMFEQTLNQAIGGAAAGGLLGGAVGAVDFKPDVNAPRGTGSTGPDTRTPLKNAGVRAAEAGADREAVLKIVTDEKLAPIDKIGQLNALAAAAPKPADTGLQTLGNAGAAISDNMRSGMWAAFEAGSPKFGGIDDPALAVALSGQAGEIKTRAQFDTFLDQYGRGELPVKKQRAAATPLDILTPIDEAAHRAATSPLNHAPPPTPEQIEAENYEAGHIKGSDIGMRSLDFAIEYPRGVDRNGIEMRHHYGRIPGTVGGDGMAVDFFMGNDDSDRVYLYHRLDQEGRFHQHKAMLGMSKDEAEATLEQFYRGGTTGNKNGPMVDLSKPEFEQWMANGNTGAPHPAAGLEGTRRVDGAETRAITPGGQSVNARYALVEAGDLISSHTITGRANSNFPQDLQPRDRSRAGLRQWIVETAARFEPALATEGASAAEGAPIVGPDNVVESGNGRMQVITKLYLDKSTKYRDYLAEHAERYGLTKADVNTMARPVLVRVRTDPMDMAARAKFAAEANRPPLATYSATEQANADARTLGDAELSTFAPSADGNVLSPANEPFVRNFVSKLPATERAGLMTAEGQPTRQLAQRIQSAVFASAYQDDRLLTLMAEDANPDVRSVVAALTTAAPAFARARAAGMLEQADVVEPLIQAVEIIRRTRASGQSVPEYLDQGGLFDKIPADVDRMARFIDSNIRSSKRMGEAFTAMAGFLETEGARRQSGSLFGEEPKLDVGTAMQAANQRMQANYGGGGQAGLFSRNWSPDEVYQHAMANQPQLVAAGHEIAAALGLEFKNPGVKARTTAEEKVGRKNKPIGAMTDIVRAGFVSESPERAAEAIAELGRRFPHVHDEGVQINDVGFFNRVALVRFENGQVGEVQFWSQAMYSAKFPVGDKLYARMRMLRVDGTIAPEHVAEFEALRQQSLELYARAAARSEAWLPAVESSASPEFSRLLTRERQAGSESSAPSWEASSTSTLAQAPERSANAPSPPLGSTPETTGSPSSLQKNLTGSTGNAGTSTDSTSAGSIARVRSWIEPHLERVASIVPFEVVQSAQDLPDPHAPADVEGAYFQDGRVYFVADNLPTQARAREVAEHEVFGHLAMEREPAFAKTLENVKRALRAGAMKDLLAHVQQTHGLLDATTEAKEVVALMAERGVKSPLATSLRTAVRAARAAFGFETPVDEAELTRLVGLAAKDLAHDARVMRDFRAAQGLPAVQALDKAQPTDQEILDAIDAVYARDSIDGPLYQRAWHGSPHEFEKFSLAHIGTGEGAQVYGQGLYFSSKREVADWYRKQLAGEEFEFLSSQAFADAKPALLEAGFTEAGISVAEEELAASRGRIRDAMGNLRYYAQRGKNIAANKDGAQALLSLMPSTQRKKNGRVYEVEIPDEHALLDTAKLVKDQPPAVRAALARLAREIRDGNQSAAMWDRPPTLDTIAHMKGQEVYEALVRYYRGKNSGALASQKTQDLNAAGAASEALKEAGIPGHTYIGRDSGERNYVIYDDAAIETKAVYSRGASKAPATLYHGTGADFTAFKEGPVFMTTNRQGAEWYAHERGQDGTPKILPVSAKIARPLDANGKAGTMELLRIARDAGVTMKITEYKDGSWDYEGPGEENNPLDVLYEDRVRAALKAAGYDGVHASDTLANDSIDTWIALDPEQVSAGPLHSRAGTVAGVPNDIQELMERVMAKPAEAVTIKDRLRETWRKLTDIGADRIQQGLVDSFNAIKQIEKGQFGDLLDAAQSPYKAALATRNLPSVMAATMLRGVPVYKDGVFQPEQGRRGILEIFRPLTEHKDGNLLPLWELYAAAKRAKGLLAQGREKLFSAEDIRKATALAQQYPLLETVAKEWETFNGELLDLAAERGVLDPESVKVWRQNFYVPFYRAMEEAATEGPRTGGGLEGHGGKRVQKRLTGSETPLGHVFENMLMNTAYLIDESFKNTAMQKIVAMAEGTALERIPMKWDAVKLPAGVLEKALDQLGAAVSSFKPDPSSPTGKSWQPGLSQAEREEWLKVFRRVAPVGNDVVSVFEGGRATYYRVTDDLLLRSIGNMGHDTFSDIFGIFRGTKKLLTHAITLDPAFTMANWVRDTLSTWVQSDTGITPIIGAVKGFQSALAMNDDMLAIMAGGGGGGGIYDMQPDELRKYLVDKLGSGSAATQFANTIVSPKNWVRLWRKVGNAAENANRVATYKAVRARGGSQAEAVYQARDVLNFTMTGDFAAMRWLTATVPFMNARVQGLYRLWRGAQDNPGGFALKGMMLMGATLALLMGNNDKKEYEELSDWDRDMYWHFWLGGEHWRLPKPFEVGAIFGTVPERIFRLGTGRDSAAIAKDRVLAMLGNTFAFNPIPQAVKPLMEQYANRNSFTGSPIVGLGDIDLKPEAQYTPWTSETLRRTAEALPDWAPAWLRSPERLEALLRGYTGTMGTYALAAADSLTRSALGGPAQPERKLYDLPVVKRFLQDPTPRYTKYADQLYSMLEESNAVFSTIKRYKEQGRIEEAADLLNENRSKLAVRKRLNRIATNVRALNNQTRMVMYNDTMGPAEKRRRLDEITEQKNKLTGMVAPFANLF